MISLQFWRLYKNLQLLLDVGEVLIDHYIEAHSTILCLALTTPTNPVKQDETQHRRGLCSSLYDLGGYCARTGP